MNTLQERPTRCLITGASGFIGTRLCEYFDEQQNQNYVPLTRNPQAAIKLRSRWPQLAVGDLMNVQQTKQALKGCDAVIHLAHSSDGPHATRNLVNCAIDSGIKRFVHISTMSVHGPSPGPESAREDTAKIGRYNHDYSDSKAEQEEIVQAAYTAGNLRTIILRPTIVYGPQSHFVLQVIQQAKDGKVIVFDDGSGICNAVYVDDVCRAIDASLTSEDAIGQAIFINGDQNLSWGEFIKTFAFMVKPKPEVISLDSAEALRYWAAHPPVQIRNFFDRVILKLKRTLVPAAIQAPWPPLGRIQRETFPIFFANDKAKKILRWAPQVSFSKGSALTHEWLNSKGDLS